MALARLYSGTFIGLEGVLVDVEVDAKKSDKNSFVLVGLPDLAVKESKDRVFSALKNSGFSLHGSYCTVNLAPADLKKEGSFYDLPIALGLLLSQEKLKTTAIEEYLCVGELSLSGAIRPLRGAIALALLARSLKKKGILVPKANAAEAAAVPGIDVIGVSTLQEAVRFFEQPYSPIQQALACEEELEILVDLQEIQGQAQAKRALEIAAAGNHHILFYGPPGTGKTLLAKAIVGLLPPLPIECALEVTKIHSLAGILPPEKGLIRIPPFRNPHHTASAIALIGGGSTPGPGEISLAHRGVLFLDELPEFPRHVLETLRQPLENGSAAISRASGRFIFPSRCLLIAAMNPCPCGMLGHPHKPCRDTPLQIQKYRNKISGPLLDRIDMHVEVPVLSSQELRASTNQESSRTVRERITKTREKQKARRSKLNAELTPAELGKDCALKGQTELLLRQAMDQMGLSARAVHRILKVARTIADLEQQESIETAHIMEALSFRSWDSQNSS